jgi:hypothetical protein
MATAESNISNACMIALSKVGATTFRNNVGLGWTGKALKQTKERMVKVYPGDVLVKNARPLHAGLCKGSADLIGWMPVVITQEMVGSTVAVFLAPEIKTATGIAATHQKNFIAAVLRHGGRAGIARSPEEAVEIALQTPP